MKRQNRKTGLLLALLLAVSMILSACSETDITESQSSVSGGSAESQSADESTIAELQAQIAELQAENEALRNQLHQYTDGQASAETAQENTEQTAETEGAQETQTAEVPEEDKLNIVVLGDSIWDMDRGDTGIAAQVAAYMNANVYNCAIGGTRASLKEGESDVNYDTWDSTSLTGMCYVLCDLVSPEFLEGYPAGGVIRNVDPSTVDFYIVAYGLNDYFAGAPIAVKDGDTYDAHGYAGALRNAIALLRNASPNAQILLISPTYCQFYEDGYIVAYGLNDYFAGAPIAVKDGDTYDAHGYAGALRNAIALLRNASPNAQILLISPTYCQFYEDGYMVTDSNMKDYGNGTLTDYANACRNVSETENTLYIDAYTTMGINIYTAEEYLEDGVHLTEAGRALYAKAVSSCLKYGKPGEVSGNSIYY